MRLTLRTLLSYLDDTLDPGQAKVIGQKVAESEQARELMERIKQVTRRRRLTTPPAAGPGGIDANTIAEYLDNEVTPEQAAEVEQICLASDVHLAEVAACHQILTLVLGEPALVPPSARQRMYGLVKGPEAIPFRKPPKAQSKADLDLSTSDAGIELDDTLRPAGILRNTSMRNTILLIGGGVAAICVLIFALYMNFSRGTGKEENPRKDQAIVQADSARRDKDRDHVEPKDKDQKNNVEPEKKQGDDKKGSEGTDPKKEPDKKGSAEPEKKTPPENDTPSTQEIAYAPPATKAAVVGVYEPNAKNPTILLQREAGDKGNWVRLGNKNVEVASVRPVMSLPASRADVQVTQGVHLNLWGTMPDIWPNPYLFESRAKLYTHPALSTDLTLERGRVVLKNARKDGKPAAARIRFDNPMQKKEEWFDVTLMDADSEVMIDHVASFRPDEPFYEDPQNPNRIGPTVDIHCFFLSGTANLRWGGNQDFIDARRKVQYVTWNSLRGTTPTGPQESATPDWLLPDPKAGDPKARRDATQALVKLANNMKDKQLDVALREALDTRDNVWLQRLALWSYMAIDDYSVALELLNREETPPDLRRFSVYALRYWMAQGPNNEYEVFDALKKDHGKVVARKLMELLHGVTPKDQANPETWKLLISDLDNSVLPLRELSAWNLETLVPWGAQKAGGFHATMPEGQRRAIQAAWRQVIPPGELPKAPQQKK
jgi:hypothetical protein